jgi:hypothetical protein
MDFISPVGVGFAATRRVWNVRLHQGLVPLPDFGTYGVPLSQITGVHSRDQPTENTETKDDAFHPCAPAFSGGIIEAMFVPKMLRCGKFREKLTVGSMSSSGSIRAVCRELERRAKAQTLIRNQSSPSMLIAIDAWIP